MKRKKGIFRKFVVMSLLLSLALTPMAMDTGNTVYAENTEKTKQPERSAEYGTDIHQSGRLPSAESGSAG